MQMPFLLFVWKASAFIISMVRCLQDESLQNLVKRNAHQIVVKLEVIISEVISEIGRQYNQVF